MNQIPRGEIVVPSLPFFFKGKVIKGFGRGSKQLGIPTANLPVGEYDQLMQNVPVGVYYGWASVDRGPVFGMAMSIGWNPFFKNIKKTVEVHLFHQFEHDFYDSELCVIALGFIRKELDFKSLDELIKAIKEDIIYSQEQLSQPAAFQYYENFWKHHSMN